MSSAPDLLLDENLSWRVARGLRAEGYSVITTAEAQLAGLRDEDIFRYARTNHLIIVSRDTDFRLRFGPPHNGIILVQASALARNVDILTCLLAQLPLALDHQLADTIHIIAC